MLFLAAHLLTSVCFAAAQAPRIDKVDPPNWYATFPKPMLLLRGENLKGATVSLSDSALKVERTAFSDNGHWAQVWLSASPAQATTVTLRVKTSAGQTDAPYAFAKRRAASDGMGGFSSADVMEMILTDRFADGDKTNDGPEAKSSADSPEAAAERAKPMGWHGGDLRGIAQHLDYLQSFGVTAVWPTPVYQNHSPVAYHGYHATDYYAVDEHYGSMADLQGLAKALHAKGMKLILDTVPNHVGPMHPWVNDEPAPDWFHGTKAQHISAEYNFNALVDPHAPDRDRLATQQGWFVNELPDMNTDSPAVSQYLLQNVIWWIEQTGADGLRYDTFPYVGRQFWHDLNFTLRTLYPRLTEVGEASDGNPEITAAFADGATGAGVDTGLYTPFDFPLYHGTRDVWANGQPMTHLRDLLRADYLYAHPERLVPFLGNHDESRFAGAVHDADSRGAAYAFLMTVRGTPQLYIGDEIAMPGGNDPDNRRDFPGGFLGDNTSAFNPAQRTPEQKGLLDWIMQLAAWRKAYVALQCGEMQVLAADKDTLVYGRAANPTCRQAQPNAAGDRVLIALHRGAQQSLIVDLANTALSGCRPQPLGSAPAPSVAGESVTLTLFGGAALFTCK